MDQNPFPVLTAKDASLLMSKRSLLPHKVHISVKGCVTSMSEKMRVKNDDFFLIQLDNCVFILVKDFHLYWHSQIAPQDTVVFYELRLTTIEKGVSTPQPILNAWRPSRILKAPYDENVAVLTVEEWLSWVHLKDRFDWIPSDDAHIESVENAVSFSGKVTGNSEASDGIYELDNSIRLVTWLNSSILGNSCLDIGCDITVYNAHEVKNSDFTDGQALVCCARTLIRVEPSTTSSKVETMERERKRSHCGWLVGASSWTYIGGLKTNSSCILEDLKSTISKYRLNFKEIECILRLRNSLKARKRMEVTYLLHNITKSFCCRSVQDERVSLLDMFLRHNDFCPFVSAKSSISRLKSQVTVARLKEDNAANDFVEENSKITSSQTWSYKSHEWKDREMLLGTVLVNGKGQTEFEDHSGKIPVVLVHNWDKEMFHRTAKSQQSLGSLTEDIEKQQSYNCHKCSYQCQKECKPTDKLSCPFITSSVAGKMFYVTYFVLVTENYLDARDSCEKNTYLIFSLQGCVILDTVPWGLSSISIFSTDAVWTHDSKGNPKYHDYVLSDDRHQACYVYVSDKQQQLYSREHGFYFQLQGRILDPSLFIYDTGSENFNQVERENEPANIQKSLAIETSKANDCKLSAQVTALKRKHENLLTVSEKSKIRNIKGLDLELTPAEKLNSSKPILESLSQSVPITMHFGQKNVRYFPMIHPGHCYQLLTNKTASAAFQPMFSNAKLGKAVMKCGAKTCVKAPENLKVTAIDWGNSSVGKVITAINVEDTLVPVTLAQVLSEECQDSLVSFTAIILGREVQRSYFSSSRDYWVAPSLSDVRLDLCRIDSYLSGEGNGFEDTVSLYFNSSQMLYVFGLIPGSVVDVSCVERKVSKNNTVYCKFISVSSIHIRYFVSQGQDGLENASSSKTPNFTQLPREYILTIWNHGPGAYSRHTSAVWHIRCHICVVFSIKLELLCKKCNSLFINNECQRRGCGNASFDVVVNSAILVEDGTCQAIVKLRQPRLVCKLLTLNDEQWDDLVSILHDTGQISISKQGDDVSSSSPCGVFLSGLMASSLVVRPVKMLVRVFKNSFCRKMVNKMEDKEFKLKDFYLGKASLKTLHLPYLSLDCIDLNEECTTLQ